jgi:hypothetical protein
MKEKLYDIPIDHPLTSARRKALDGHLVCKVQLSTSPVTYFVFVHALRSRFVHMFQQFYAQSGPPGLVARAQPPARIPMELRGLRSDR